MSILNVTNLTHGFGDRAIFNNVSFRLLKGEHIGLVGANGEGKSTFLNIVTGKLMPDEGNIEWALIKKKLNDIGYAGAISLEVTNEFSEYSDYKDPKVLLKRAYEAALRLAE
jgi:ABC-type branched-subunit amino acid transport system ATPase component